MDTYSYSSLQFQPRKRRHPLVHVGSTDEALDRGQVSSACIPLVIRLGCLAVPTMKPDGAPKRRGIYQGRWPVFFQQQNRLSAE